MEANENQNEETLDTNANAAVENAPSTQAEASVDDAQEVDVYSPDDATLERAVKAGMSLSDAKALPNKEFADRILGALERGNPTGSGAVKTDGNDGDDMPVVDFTGFGEEQGYDPNLSKAMNSLKTVIEAQAKVIKSLKAGMSAKSQTKTVETRKNLTLARPGGESGRKSTPANAEADILSALRQKFKLG